MNRLQLALLSVSVTTLAFTAQAQTLPENALSTAEPGRVSEQLRDAPFAPTVSPEISIKDVDLQKAPPGADKINLTLTGLNISGVTAYTQDQLAPLYTPYIGQTVTLAQVYAIANDLKLKYRNEGYLLAQVIVPPQTIDSGIVNLQVVEGTVDSVVVQGEETAATELVRKYAGQIATGGALNIAQLERQLLLINDLPGVTARSVLSPSPNVTGAADLRIIVERDPFDALIGVNNNGSKYLGPLQFVGAATANNHFNLNESQTAQVVFAPQSINPFDYELGYLALQYNMPVWSHGTTLQIFTSLTDTDPGFDLKQFDVEGKSIFASIGLEHPFIRSRAQNLYGRVSFDYRNVKTSNNLPEPTREDDIRALRAGVRYDFLDTFLGVGVNSIDLEFAKGLDLFGASDKGDANLSRAAGDPDFFKLNAEIQRLQRITSSVNLLLAGSAQWSNDALLASEEFGVGGINIGRAYDPSEIVGDEGIAGKVELQWKQPVQWNLVEDYQVFGFYDAGRVWNDDPTTADQKRDSVISTGFGLRTDFGEHVNADLTVAFPLSRDVETQRDRDPRVYFSLTKQF